MTSQKTKESIRQYINGMKYDPDFNPDMNENLCMIKFQNPSQKSREETSSKFLLPDSELNFFIINAEYKLKHAGFRFDNKLPPHVEIGKNIDVPTFLKRVEFLEGKRVDISKPENYKVINGKRFVLLLPSCSEMGLNEPYITIAYVNHLCNKERFLKIVLDNEYDTSTSWE